MTLELLDQFGMRAIRPIDSISRVSAYVTNWIRGNDVEEYRGSCYVGLGVVAVSWRLYSEMNQLVDAGTIPVPMAA